MPVQNFAMCLNRSDHAGHHTGTVAERWSATEQANHLGLEARPGTGRELAQQLAIEPGVQSQTPGDGQHDLPMRDGKTDFFGNVDRGQQGPLLVAGWARTTLLAGEGDKHLVLAVGAANSRNKPTTTIAAYLDLYALKKAD